MRTDYKLWPYGAYINRSFVYFFDRRYQPIVFGPWNYYCPFTRRLTITTHLAPIDPATRINFDTQGWIYRDATSPKRDRQTRAMPQRMLKTWPALQREIERRQAVRA
jgi:hypothetical protein